MNNDRFRHFSGLRDKLKLRTLCLLTGVTATALGFATPNAWAATDLPVEWEWGSQEKACWIEASNADSDIVVGFERRGSGRIYGYLATYGWPLPEEARMSFILGNTTYAVDGSVDDQERLIAPLGEDFMSALAQAGSLYIGAGHDMSHRIALDGMHRDALTVLKKCAATL